MEDPDVLAKQSAAVEWCRLATAHSVSVDGGKPWSFALIPHNAIMENQTLTYLLGRFIVSSPAWTRLTCRCGPGYSSTIRRRW